MEILTIECGPIGTNAFYIWDEGAEAALLVDAPPGIRERLPELEKQTGRVVKTLLLTHGHWDHMLDAAEVRRRGARVYAHPDDGVLLSDPELMASFAMPGLSWEAAEIDEWLNGGETLELLGQTVEVRHVPGHAPGSLLFYFPKAGVAFGGDALFAGGVGRFDLPGGDWETLERSIREQIYSLPPETVVYPGHGPATTVVREMEANPFVSG
jgi:glyoxylase-like metal-dependent hydrolase (beta-lactamase superfamily II)